MEFGSRVLLVTSDSSSPELKMQYEKVIELLTLKGISVAHFDGVRPNPTTDMVREGAELARVSGAKVIIGYGGGSSMDAAKAISVEATHDGSCWDYLFYKTPQPDPGKLIPVITVTTTSGTGAHITQIAVITNSNERDKSALYNASLFPKVSIIDPELMVSVPAVVTANTGFDVFCHAFESILHPKSNRFTELLAWEAISIVFKTLPLLRDDLKNIELRERMAFADTLAGMVLSNTGVTLPHGVGMAIGGMYPHVAHGEALAIVYPSFASFTWESAVEKFAKVGRMLNGELNHLTDKEAASHAPGELTEFLKSMGLFKKLRDVKVPESEIQKLALQSMVLPDYLNNPRIAGEEEMTEIVKSSF